MSIVDESIDLSIRRRCHGELPLDARLEPWMVACFQDKSLTSQIAQYGSPLNLIATAPMVRNIAELNKVTADRDVDSQIFFARKSNKCLAFIDQAIQSNIGIDTASETEVRQSLDRGVDPASMICTAAIKNTSLLSLCLDQAICIAVDNHDELKAISEIALASGRRSNIALRLGGFIHQGQKLPTRFGFDAQHDRQIVDQIQDHHVQVIGVQFHLDGYDASQRVSGILQSLQWIRHLRDVGNKVCFLDIGGGFPVRYIESPQQWEAFWGNLKQSLLGQRSPITYRNHGLGFHQCGDAISGTPKVYPSWQPLQRQEWFASILDSRIDGKTIASLFRDAGLQLRCEPGRSLMDGCGVSVAQVEFRKQNADGDWLIGLAMNRTQCRTTSDDFLVDPIVISQTPAAGESMPLTPMTGYLVGAYCTECELISLRRLTFPRGISRGDLVVFPNTAGYLMHFLESRSHQFPLAKNLIHSTGELDLIDAGN